MSAGPGGKESHSFVLKRWSLTIFYKQAPVNKKWTLLNESFCFFYVKLDYIFTTTLGWRTNDFFLQIDFGSKVRPAGAIDSSRCKNWSIGHYLRHRRMLSVPDLAQITWGLKVIKIGSPAPHCSGRGPHPLRWKILILPGWRPPSHSW